MLLSRLMSVHSARLSAAASANIDRCELLNHLCVSVRWVADARQSTDVRQTLLCMLHMTEDGTLYGSTHNRLQ